MFNKRKLKELFLATCIGMAGMFVIIFAVAAVCDCKGVDPATFSESESGAWGLVALLFGYLLVEKTKRFWKEDKDEAKEKK